MEALKLKQKREDGSVKTPTNFICHENYLKVIFQMRTYFSIKKVKTEFKC